MSQNRLPRSPLHGAGVPLVAALTERVPSTLTRWALYIWMFSLPYNVVTLHWLPSVLQGYLSIPRMAGLFLLPCFLLDPRTRPWKLPAAFWAFVTFFVVFAVSMLRSDFSSFVHIVAQFQLLILFFICYNLFLGSQRVRGIALFSYVTSCVTASVLTLSGLAVDHYKTMLRGGRETAFGADPNLYSMVLMAGILAAIGLAHIRKEKHALRVPVLWASVVLILAAIGKSASRGATLALAAGVLTFILRKGSLVVRLRNLVLLALIAGAVYGVLSRSQLLVERWTLAIETGSTSSRTKIWREAIEMVKEKPIFGWGPKATENLAERLQCPSSILATHNMVLNIMTFTGLVGFLPYLWGYIAVFRASWQARSGVEDILPMAIFISIFFTDMICGGLPGKFHWTWFAYILASSRLTVSCPRILSKRVAYS